MKQDSSWRKILHDGGEKWLLIHIEIQGYQEIAFSKRVFHCYYRIYDEFGEDLISVAVLSDDNPEFRENIYEISHFGFRLHFEFPVIKLLDYRHKWGELEHDPNPFAIVTMAFLKTVETQGRDHDRYQWKKHFFLELYHRGLTQEVIVAIYEFIDIVMALPQIKDDELYDEVKKIKEENKMSIFTTAERAGMKQGLAQGLAQTISDILEIKFGLASLGLLDQINQITEVEALQKIRAGVKQAQSLAEAVIHTYAKEQSGNGQRN